MLDIWSEVKGTQHIKPIMLKMYRLVESQEQVATLSLVNNVYEQGMLEELIETTKSPFKTSENHLHYLLKTPFRYPPLKYGSRFGRTFEQGIFYGSLNMNTALAETAYYRFVFMMGPERPYSSIISSEYTAFSISVKSERSILLDEPPFVQFIKSLICPISYQNTQLLGSSMRESGVEIFRFISARDKEQGKNIGLFSPNVFCKNKPSNLMQWFCQTSSEEVGFLAQDEKSRLLFKREDFLINGVFPSPAV
jgi:hypothetical protein